ncbi:hypothetical protein [Sphingomonas parva]|uniref:hypothetical protein n=1 Tax=Sphingomonas parva TaxID=2555898 RepID=UPI00384A72C3
MPRAAAEASEAWARSIWLSEAVRSATLTISLLNWAELGGEHLGLEQGAGGEAAAEAGEALDILSGVLDDDGMRFLRGGADRGEQGGERDVALRGVADEAGGGVRPCLPAQIAVLGDEIGLDHRDERVELFGGESRRPDMRLAEMRDERPGDPLALGGEQRDQLATALGQAPIRIESSDPLLQLHRPLFRRHEYPR